MFEESKFDILQTGRSGHPEYPFTQINSTPQVDLITLPGMAERKANVVKTVHISAYQANTWVRAGGDPQKVDIVPLFDQLSELTKDNLKKDLGLEGKFVYGLHQRDDNGIFSSLPLTAYKNIELQSDDVAFVFLVAVKNKKTKLRHLVSEIFILYLIPEIKKLSQSFFETIDVYTHGRADGETFSLAISEAMYHSLPIISHVAPAMGHAETIGDAGVIANNLDMYIGAMSQLKTDQFQYKTLSTTTKKRFDELLSLPVNISKFINIYETIYKSNRLVKAEDDWLSDWVDD